MFGAFLIVFCAAAILSLAGYDANDASYNVAIRAPVHNFLGSFGANADSLIVSSFGASLIVFLIAPIVWGYGFLRLREFLQPWARITAFVFGAFFLSVFFGLLPEHLLGAYQLGGTCRARSAGHFIQPRSRRKHQGT